MPQRRRSMLLIYGTAYLIVALGFLLQIFIFLPYEFYVTSDIVFCYNKA